MFLRKSAIVLPNRFILNPMQTLNWTTLNKTVQGWRDDPDVRRMLWLSAIFFGVMLALGLHRLYTFYAAYDHGLFNQVFWNSVRGRWFQSSLTSGNSVGVMEDGNIPILTFMHLAHHFIPDFLLWLPFYALFQSPATLVMLQVGLMTAAGWVLYALARHYLEPDLSLMITASYYGAIAVIGPTLADFYEHCQMPLFVFGMLLAMEKRRWWIFWIMTVLVLGIREDAGFITFGIGIYLLVSRRHPRIGALLCLLSFSYVALVTNKIVGQLSDDSSRLYLAVRFRHFAAGKAEPTTLDILWGMLTHPGEVLRSLLTPFDRRLFYLVRQWLPLAFIPALSGVAWLTIAVPLLTLFVQTGQSALSITLRYALAIVPGVFYGAILWWACHREQFRPRLRRLWKAAIGLSIVLVLLSNPNRTISYLIPDSFVPWVHVPLPSLWAHSASTHALLRTVPPDVSVSATTHIIPHLSNRRAIFRLPLLQFRNDQGQLEDIEYLVADLWRHYQYIPAFKDDRGRLLDVVNTFDRRLADNSYGLIAMQDGVAMMRRGASSSPEALQQWNSYRQEVLAALEKLQKK